MVDVAEAATAKVELAAGLAAGIKTLSLDDSVIFTKYVRLVLPLDGFVFWVKADLLTSTALLNVSPLNTVELDAPQLIASQAATMTVKGSFHYSTRNDQNEDETVGLNTVIFTSLTPIQQFNAVGENVLWIGTYAGDDEGYDAPTTFAFSNRGRYYKTADLFHYSGTAALPAFLSQLINNPLSLSQKQLVVSNSLPAWLSLNNYAPPYPGFTNAVPLYPSFLVPDNLPPPYGVVHVIPEGTQGLQSAPAFNSVLSQSQLSQDKVRITLYGLNNDAAEAFLAAALQFIYDGVVVNGACVDALGLVNMPVIADDKRVQPELNVLAMKKTIEFDVTYNQASVRNVARQMIVNAINGYQVKPLNAVENYGLLPYAI